MNEIQIFTKTQQKTKRQLHINKKLKPHIQLRLNISINLFDVPLHIGFVVKLMYLCTDIIKTSGRLYSGNHCVSSTGFMTPPGKIVFGSMGGLA